jgi:hypothetical protein
MQCKRVIIVFTKGKHPFLHKLGYHTKGYIKDYMSFVQVVEMEPAYQKHNGHENLVLTLWAHPRLQAIKLLASLT